MMQKPTEEKEPGTRYYKCVNCGHLGDFKKHRVRKLNCQKCKYDLITPFDSEEWREYHEERRKIRDWMDGKIKEWQ